MPSHPSIAVIHPSFTGVGGAEILALSQAKCLRELGYNVRVITGAFDPARWSAEFEGLAVDVLGRRDWLDRFTGRETWIARRAERLARLLPEVDVAVAHNYPMSRVLADAPGRSRKIWYCNEPYREIHLDAAHPTLSSRYHAGIDTGASAEAQFVRYRRRQRALLPGIRHRYAIEREHDLKTVEKIDILCANSGYARELAMRSYGHRPCKVVYPIVRFPERGAARAGLDRSELRILVHTRLVAEKNVDTILRGFARFTSAGRYRARLHVVGEGPSRPSLEELARSLGLGTLTQFHGFVSRAELRQIYDLCEVFALLPVDEPFGMVFPEAAARGLLLVGPNHGGPVEILENGKFGFLTDAFSPDELASVFERICALSDQEVNALRESADEACRTRFSASTVGPQMVAAYELR